MYPCITYVVTNNYIAKQGKTKQALLRAMVLKLEAPGELVQPRMLVKSHALTPAAEFWFSRWRWGDDWCCVLVSGMGGARIWIQTMTDKTLTLDHDHCFQGYLCVVELRWVCLLPVFTYILIGLLNITSIHPVKPKGCVFSKVYENSLLWKFFKDYITISLCLKCVCESGTSWCEPELSSEYHSTS